VLCVLVWQISVACHCLADQLCVFLLGKTSVACRLLDGMPLEKAVSKLWSNIHVLSDSAFQGLAMDLVTSVFLVRAILQC